MKLSPKVSALALAVAAATLSAPLAQAAADTTRVIVAFKPGQAGAARAAVAAARGSVKLEIFGTNAMAVEVPSAALAGLARNPNVEYVEEDVKRHLFASGTTPSTGNPYTAGQLVPYGIPMVQADRFAGVSAATRKVCIIDSGYDLGHPDLPGSNVVTGDNDPGTGLWSTDENSHGTHVAGTIAALNNNSGVVGVVANGTLRLHIIKVFGAERWAYSSTLASAANKCAAAGSNIISMSLGGGRASKTEQRTFDTLLANGILPIAAAGNSGNSQVSYPAGYSSVISVGAVDAAKAHASFSQFNSDVELAGPGVNTRSTVPRGTGRDPVLTVGGTAYVPGSMDGSPARTATGALADFGIGNAAVAGSMTGKVCLIARGTVDFVTKVRNCQASGGIGAVVYNNVAGSFGGTLGTTDLPTIPSVTASDTDGAAMKQQLGSSATVGVTASDHANFDGTSMATPHVSAVAALVWAMNPQCTAAQLRLTLQRSAEDLGTAGRDTRFGFGLARAGAAHDRIAARGCGL